MRRSLSRGVAIALRVIFFALLAALSACKGGATADDRKFDIDADPLALLPSGAIVVSWVDAHTLFAGGRLGPRLSDLAEKFIPLAEDTGFVPSRDVLQIVSAAYATGDGVTIVQGRFDPSHIEATQTTRRGASVTHGTYGGRVTSTTGQVSFAILTSHTAIAATGDGLRQALDRVTALEAGGKVAPALAPWMSEPFANRKLDPGAAIAIVADLASQPMAAAALATLKFPWLDGVQRGKVLVGVSESPTRPGLNVSATLTYADAERAEEAAKGVRTSERWLRVLGPLLGGVALDAFDVTSQASDLRCSFAVPDPALTALLSLATKLFP